MAPPHPYAAFRRLPLPAQGAAWAITASAFFAGMIGVIRHLAEVMPPLQIVFFRNLFGLAFMLPWLMMSGWAAMRTGNHRLYLGRSIIGLLSMFCWFTGVALMPLNESTALAFTAPLFTTIAAVIFLGEIVRVRRWTAIAVGFLGAMVILRPGIEELTLPQALILGSAAFAGINAILIKQLTRTETPNAIVTYMTLYILPFSLLAALPVWIAPPLETWLWLVALGLFATLGHQALTRAFVCMDASAVTALDFVRLPFVALIAWFGFAETPDGWTWFGAAIIVAASAYTTHREAIIAREARDAAAAKVAASTESATIATLGVSNPHPPSGRAERPAADD
jgi:drug/metabolite transporter (DMT)-like permease